MNKKSNSIAIRGPQRCRCGRCVGCVENERWEWIFQQKYGQQERDYYAAGRESRSAGISAKAFADASIFACTEEVGIDTKAGARAETNTDRFHSALRRAIYTDTAA